MKMPRGPQWHSTRCNDPRTIDYDKLPDAAALKHIEQALWDNAETRGAAIMVGSGLTRTANQAAGDAPPPPLWSDFADAMANDLYQNGKKPKNTNPLQLAQEYETTHGRTALDDLIRTRINDASLTPSTIHRQLVALPWTDILTTNYDTLLERAAENQPNIHYATVHTIKDIPRTRAPRIVKLHGSLPSHTPFIITEEDFRTYPTEFAPFVNLAQQILTENALCLIGFSGDDPNFLQWSGWVRDHLGKHAPPIYLIGALQLATPARRRLEARGVNPIDLTPLLTSSERENRHEAAIKLFLHTLKQAKPWPRQNWPVSPPGTKPQEPKPTTIEQWTALRETYPGWIIAPHPARQSIAHNTEREWPDIGKTLNDLPQADCHRALYEYAWRQEVALLQLPDNLIGNIEEAITTEQPTPSKQEGEHLSRREREQLALWLLRHARETHNAAMFDHWKYWLEQHVPAQQHAICWEQCLRARDNLNLPEMEQHLDCVNNDDDPIWTLRRASILSELNKHEEAFDTALNALRDLRTRSAQDTHSIWLASRLEWALYICRNVGLLRNPKPPEEDIGEHRLTSTWPEDLRTLRCDPWQERRDLTEDLHTALEKKRKPQIEIRYAFDPGRSTRWEQLGPILPSRAPFRARRFLDQTGIPRRLDMVSLSVDILELAARVDGIDTTESILNLVLIRADDDLLDEQLSRLTVARLPNQVIDRSIIQLRQALTDSMRRYDKTEGGDDGWRECSAWIGRVTTIMEVLSRALIRADNETLTAVLSDSFRLADRVTKHWWFFEPLNNLLSRGLGALPPNERAAFVLQAIELQLPGERATTDVDRHWPEVIDAFEQPTIDRSPETERWAKRIQEMTDAAQQFKCNLQRERAIMRLHCLHKWGILEPAEQAAFGQALWAKRANNDGLPIATGLHRHVMLTLPEPEPGLAIKVFEQEVIQLQTSTQPTEYDLVALFNAARINPDDSRYSLTRDQALIWLNRTFEKNAHIQSATDDDPMIGPEEKQRFQDEVGSALAGAILPKLTPEDLTDSMVETALAEDAPRSMTFALPTMVALKPDLHDRVVERLRATLAGTERNDWYFASWAIHEWVTLEQAGAPAAPDDLVSEIAGAVLARNQHNLLTALDVATKLVENKRFKSVDLARLDNALTYLSAELDYDSDRAERVNDLGLLRARCVRLAAVLREQGQQTNGVNDWLVAAENDPLPEVRHAARTP